MVENEKKAEETEKGYDRKRELTTFDESKAGVKGLVDAGVEKIPHIFNCEKFSFNKNPGTGQSRFCIPVIDFEGVHSRPTQRSEIVQAILDASKRWGFFQVINHGIPTSLLDGMIQGIRSFHEQDSEVKRDFYTRDINQRKVIYLSNFDLYQAPVTNWRDTLGFAMEPDPPSREELPNVCRDVLIEYSKQVKQLGITIFELIAEALGLKPNYFKEMDYAKHLLILGHYYPTCPEPELAIGTTSHSDNDFLTILLQDNIGGLQVLHENQWVDVIPLHGALIVNIGELLQVPPLFLICRNSPRVLSKKEGPRISVACFFRAQDVMGNASRTYGPILELISEENPPVYRNINLKDYMEYFYSKGLDTTSALTPFKL
ncbi:1-aminocyclopropane-1-carboxylate oxidase homolog 1-like isoform X2 [Punica granatum]|uniref:1-aminocyclopropane-1-carboxylate oxidase homolog 1-like isoform X2 n=1 Tax=Punica granatum TaxID=22663 RepID=A0A6P8C718_PUNGR|nr:1-aminocyclopropane-1-carboxylate oxidase homolog 1-like isoform X2 [Punica granatum]